jgi:hypothetical protein
MPRNRKDELPDPGDGEELPWTEVQWEDFMKRADVRAARFGELLETMRDDPDRDAKLAREMGWDDLADALDAADATPAPEPPAPPVRKPRRRKPAGSNPFTSRAVAKRIPELKILDGVTMRVAGLLRDIVSAVPESDDDPRWSEAISGPMTAEAKVVGGDGMGYNDDAICGNIVKVRHGLAALEAGRSAVTSLRDERKLDAAIAEQVLQEYEIAIAAVRERIGRLRERVWWQ